MQKSINRLPFQKMKLFFSAMIFLLLAKTGFSQLHFRNQSNSDINICIGYYWESDTFTGWVTEGWFSLKTKDLMCIYCKPLINRYYYYYGYTADSLRKEYSGDVSLLVKSDAFKIRNADKQSAMMNDKFFFKRFRKIDTENSSVFTLSLGGKKSSAPVRKEDPEIIPDTVTTKSEKIEQK